MKSNDNSIQKKRKLTSKLLMALVIGQAMTILGSWIWSAAMPDSSIKSLLGDGGIRWFFASFVDNLSCPLLAWIILIDVAIEACFYNRLWEGLKALFLHTKVLTQQQKSGLRSVLVLFVIEIAILAILTLPHNAILLSITGSLFPSSFSVCIVPIISAIATTSAISYGLFSGTLHNYKDIFISLMRGGQNLKDILVIYIFAIELYFMLKYVFSL